MLPLNHNEYFNSLFKGFDIVDEHDKIQQEQFVREQLSQLPLKVILHYLKKTHQSFLSKYLPEMEQNFVHLLNHHDQADRLPILLCSLFMSYKQQLTAHIEMEENKLFPYIQTLIDAQEKEVSYKLLGQYSVSQFIEDHTDVESQFARVRQLIVDHSPKQNRPFPYCLFLTQLKEFEMNLRRHAWLEDEVLIPKVMQMEAQQQQAPLRATDGFRFTYIKQGKYAG